MESIREIAQKIKTLFLFPPIDLLIVAIIILVGFASFGLGRLSVSSSQKSPVTIVETIQSASVVSVVGDIESSPSGEVVASKNGSKYHFPWCSGAKQIAERNLITFISIVEAQQAGYTPAANCKGLE